MIAKKKLTRFYQKARQYVQKNCLEELNDIRKVSFKRLTKKKFIENYIWVVYVSGFKVSIIDAKFSLLKREFKNFDLSKLSRMRSTASVLKVFNNKRKASCVLKGASLISKEGFDNFKNRVAEEGVDALMDIPGIGEITKNHLARNIGLADVAKNDIWIQRLTKQFGAEHYTRMFDILCKQSNSKPGVVDFILWRFCADSGWKTISYPSLQKCIKEI